MAFLCLKTMAELGSKTVLYWKLDNGQSPKQDHLSKTTIQYNEIMFRHRGTVCFVERWKLYSGAKYLTDDQMVKVTSKWWSHMLLSFDEVWCLTVSTKYTGQHEFWLQIKQEAILLYEDPNIHLTSNKIRKYSRQYIHYFTHFQTVFHGS